MWRINPAGSCERKLREVEAAKDGRESLFGARLWFQAVGGSEASDEHHFILNPIVTTGVVDALGSSWRPEALSSDKRPTHVSAPRARNLPWRVRKPDLLGSAGQQAIGQAQAVISVANGQWSRIEELEVGGL